MLSLAVTAVLKPMSKAFYNGAVELYHDNVKKFETTADGVDVTGNIDINVGTDQNLKVDSNNSQVILSADNDAGNANVNLNYWASSHKFYGDQGATQQLATFNNQIIIPTSTTDPTTNLASGGIYFNSTGNALRFYNGTSWGDVSVDLSPFGSLLTSSMPHSGISVSEAGIRTENSKFLQVQQIMDLITMALGLVGMMDTKVHRMIGQPILQFILAINILVVKQ